MTPAVSSSEIGEKQFFAPELGRPLRRHLCSRSQTHFIVVSLSAVTKSSGQLDSSARRDPLGAKRA